MLNSLQACRALVAILIVLHHTEHSIFRLPKYFGCEILGHLVDFAPVGVNFFFVLSGFIITFAHTKDIGQPGACASYVWRRFSRVYLFYWCVLAATVAAFFLMPQFGHGYERDAGVIIRSILLIPHPQSQMVIVVAWTLAFEMLFYSLFALLIFDRRLGIPLFLLWTAGILVHPWLGTSQSFIFSALHICFPVGMATCMILQRGTIPAPRLLASVGVACFVGGGLAESYFGVLPGLVNILWFTLSSAVTVLGLAEAERSGLIQVPSWLANLGHATYSIYLVHFMALSLLAKTAKALRLDQYVPMVPLFVLHVVGAIAVGCLCERWIERPIDVWSRRYFVRAKRTDRGDAAIDIRKAA